jgi:hypothetical protein
MVYIIVEEIRPDYPLVADKRAPHAKLELVLLRKGTGGESANHDQGNNQEPLRGHLSSKNSWL